MTESTGPATPDEPLEHGVPADEYAEQVFEDESQTAAASEATADGDTDSDGAPADASELDQTAADLAAERLADLQRLTAEYKNFRKRTEDQRVAERERTVGDVAKQLFGVLDDLDLAEKHGDLVAGSAFATIAGKLRSVAEHLGLEKFGEIGEEFDPNQHEAVFQQPSADVDSEVVGDVVQVGYKLGGTQLRAAKVVVHTPEV